MKTELTPEESARLIELGVDPNLASGNRYTISETKEYCGYSREIIVIDGYLDDYLSQEQFFTLTDILAILPKEIDCFSSLEIGTDNGEWYAEYDALNHKGSCVFAPELIDALYQLLIWCINNGHYNPKNEER